jgi:hypothetical protein
LPSRALLLAVFLTAVAAAAFARTSGAQNPSVRNPATAADSVRILRRVKAAQVLFESRRRFQAPLHYRDADGYCERIGRFCARRSAGAFSDIPDEPAATTRERQKLLATLAVAAASLPGDSWTTGQRVRYLLEAGNDSSALTLARSCATDAWWCDALQGLTFHVQGHFVQAEQAFAHALAEMPRQMQCDWTDLSVLLEGTELDSYRKLDCDARQRANTRIWWLSDPLLMTPGNERRTAHYARLTWARVEKDGANGFGIAWGDDMRELIVRYGWAERWTVLPSTMTVYTDRLYVAHEREPNFHFFPGLSYELPLEAFGDSAWNLADDRPHESYAPEEITAFERLEPQISRFRRGDSTLIVAAFDVSGDSLLSSPPIRSALIIAPDDTTRFSIAVLDSAARRDVISIVTVTRPMLVGLELLSPDRHTAARWRSELSPIKFDSTAPALSDLLLFDATDSLAAGLNGAMATALGTRIVPQDKKIGVYWETYGSSPKDSALAITLSVLPLSPGILTRAMQALGIVHRREPVNIRWTESATGGATAAQSMLFDLSQVPRGRYELRLEVGSPAPASAVARATRVVEVR